VTEELPKSLTDKDYVDITTQWEAAGYEFKGNGYLDREDPPQCPMCAETGYFYALWQHPVQKTTVISPDGETFMFASSHCWLRCEECGYEWISGN